MDIHTIVLAVDLSESSRVAGMHAIGLARRLDARLILLHVDEIGAPDDQTGLSESLLEYLARVSDARTRWLDALTAAATAAGVTTELATVVGEADEAITEYVASSPAQLLVMGRSGAGAYRRFMLGSTTQRVLQAVSVPTLVVPFDPEHDQAPSAPVEYRSVLTTTDFSDASDRGLSFAWQLTQELRVPLTVLHVGRSSLVGAIPEEGLRPPTDLLEELRADVERRLIQSVQKLSIDPNSVEVAATVGTSVAKAIIEAAETLGSELIIIPSHGKGLLKRLFLGSTTERVIASSERPLIVLPRGWLEKP